MIIGAHIFASTLVCFTSVQLERQRFFLRMWPSFGYDMAKERSLPLDAMLNNYDRLEPIYKRVAGGMPAPALNWTTHSFGNQVSHMMVDGGAFYLFDQAAQLGIRSKKFYVEGEG